MFRVAEMLYYQTNRLLHINFHGKLLPLLQRRSKATSHRIKLEDEKIRQWHPQDEHELLKNKNELTWEIFNRFYAFLKTYSTVLQTYFPDKIVQTYNIFSKGSKALFNDMKTYSRIRRLLFQSSNPNRVFERLTRAEMELFLSLPKDLVRVAPVMAVSALPLSQNLVFPLALVFPTTFLSSHFWTQQQKEDVAREALKMRHLHFKPTFRKVQVQLPAFRGHDLHGPVRLVIGKIGSGVHPNHAEILKIASVFGNNGKFHSTNLSRSHAILLLSINDCVSWRHWISPHKKLIRLSKTISSIDRALDREGIDMLDMKDLRRVCNQRGLNIDGVGKEEMIEYLLKWNIVSCSLKEDQLTLLLHLPLLLGYNHHNRFWSQHLQFS